MAYSFQQQLKVGEEGELLVQEYLRRLYCTDVVDVRDDIKYRARGVDFIIEDEGHFEVKTDTYPPNNFFIELVVDEKPGWLFRSSADYIVYLFVKYDLMFVIPLPELRLYLWRNLARILKEEPNRKKSVRSYAGNNQWEAIGVTVPVDWIRNEVVGITELKVKRTTHEEFEEV